MANSIDTHRALDDSRLDNVLVDDILAMLLAHQRVPEPRRVQKMDNTIDIYLCVIAVVNTQFFNIITILNRPSLRVRVCLLIHHPHYEAHLYHNSFVNACNHAYHDSAVF